jgi:hypothetical protein
MTDPTYALADDIAEVLAGKDASTAISALTLCIMACLRKMPPHNEAWSRHLVITTIKGGRLPAQEPRHD